MLYILTKFCCKFWSFIWEIYLRTSILNYTETSCIGTFIIKPRWNDSKEENFIASHRVIAISILQITIAGRWEWRVHRDVHSARRWWTGRSPLWYEGRLNVGSVPLYRTIYWLVQPANGALVSCTKAPQIQPQRAKSRGGWVRERVATPMASSEGLGRDVVAYLILGNYGGTMKGAGRSCSAFDGHCSWASTKS